MPTDKIEDFAAAMAAAGFVPKKGKVIADGNWHRLYYLDERGNRDSGRYNLREEASGFLHGNYGSDKANPQFCYWHERIRDKLTPAEKREIEKLREEARASADKERDYQYMQTADNALSYWRALKPASSTAYTERKGIKPLGARQDGETLVVPMHDITGKIWSVQTISRAGDKLFWWPGKPDGLSSRCKGVYCPLADSGQDKSVMVLVEGYATGCTISAATGLPVIVCFTAGNLEAVAAAIHKKYPDTTLIIAADMDSWTLTQKGRLKVGNVDTKEIAGNDPRWAEWREAGYLYNTGKEMANRAALAVGGAFVVFPDFALDDPDKGTDFNDMAGRFGIEAVRDRIMAVLSKQEDDAEANLEPGGPDYDFAFDKEYETEYQSYMDAHNQVELYRTPYMPKNDNWRERLAFKDEKLVARSLTNLHLVLENHEKYAEIFCYDDFTHEKVVCQCPPWEDPRKFAPRTLRDEDVTMLAVELEGEGLAPSLQTLHKMVEATVKKNRRNPAQEYFNRLEWDGVKRLDQWLQRYCGAVKDDGEYVSTVGRKWLTAAVSRVFEPGCKFDHILILEGDQSVGKSRILKELATFHGRNYFDDTIKVRDLGNPATVPKMQGKIIIELAELTGFKSKDASELKQTITTTEDRIVRKYENEATTYPRQFVFAGSINPKTDGYLHDPTGNRRFWPVKVGSFIDVEQMHADKEQIWAEAVVCYREKEPLFLPPHLAQLANTAQEDRRVMDAWYPDLEARTELADFITADEAWETVGLIQKHLRNGAMQDRLSDIMMVLGFERTRRRVGGERAYGWIRKPVPVVKPPAVDEEEIAF